ncbi:MAG TPA: RsmG family class I SAM-dependent methyltransferase [Myxococcota bacterium]|nr:RsmG family class I SAM-dependent methyltransferase [Myxococcota bacterium]
MKRETTVRWDVVLGLAARLDVRPPLAPDASERLDRYLAELLRWRRVVNLVGPADPQRIADELIADALPLASVVANGDRLLDVGSGAGLPGLIVGLLRPASHVELWEPRERRAAFLRAAAQSTAATNVKIDCRRVGPREADLSHSIFSARAVWPPAEWLEVGARLSRPGARIVLHADAAPPTPPSLEALAPVDYWLTDPARRRRLYVFARR